MFNVQFKTAESPPAANLFSAVEEAAVESESLAAKMMDDGRDKPR